MVENKHIKSLDGLRGFAASMVVVSHIDSFFPTLALPWLKFGEPGVAIFFALSGFLMAYLYGGRPLTRAAGIDYLVHRFARIYPVYLLAVLVWALLSVIPDLNYIDTFKTPTALLRHIFMFGSQGIFWSIPPEIQFYIFFLLLWSYFAQPEKYQAIAVGIAGLLAVTALLHFPGPGILLTAKLPYFLFGAIAGRLHAVQPRWQPGFAVGIAVIGLLLFFIPGRAYGFFTLASFWGLPSALIAAIIVYLAACEHPLTATFFASALLRFLGMISFSLYLFHLPVMFLLAKLVGDRMPLQAVVPLAVSATVVAAWLSYRIIEAPSRRFIVSLWKNRRGAWRNADAGALGD